MQQQLAASKRETRVRGRAVEANLLSRLLYDADGNSLVSNHAVKKSRRYRYYVTRPEAGDGLRIPAGEIEPLVLQLLTSKLCDQTWLMTTLVQADASPDTIQDLTREAATLASELQHPIASRQREALQRLVGRITIRRDGLSIALKRDPLGDAHLDDPEEHEPDSHSPMLAVEVEARFVRKGQDLHLVVPPNDGADLGTRLDKALIKSIARAVTWYDDLVSGRAISLRQIAVAENVSERYVAQLLPLAMLKPELVEGVLDGTGTWSIAGSDLARGAAIPAEWEKQKMPATGAPGDRSVVSWRSAR